MNILQILQLIAALAPGTVNIITTIMTAIHSAPGTPAHSTAVNTVVVPATIPENRIG